jgi:hypothetical protein
MNQAKNNNALAEMVKTSEKRRVFCCFSVWVKGKKVKSICGSFSTYA